MRSLPASLTMPDGLDDAFQAFRHCELAINHPRNAWALAEDTCKFVATLIRRLRPERVLEFGSGISSTVIATELIRVPGAQLISVDHNKVFQATAQRLAEEHHVSEAIKFYRCPIRPSWWHGKLLFFYDIGPALASQMASLDLVLVDGPSYWGREAAAYAVYPHLKPGALILVDDAHRKGEREYLGEWSKLYGRALEVASREGFERGLGIFRKCESISPRRMFGPRECQRAFFAAFKRAARNRRRLADCV